MTQLYEKFSNSIRWGALESIIYQVLLLGHQVILFKVSTPELYGITGTIFSLLYVSIAIANLGFNASLAPFFTLAMNNKQSFKKIIILNLIPEICILILGVFFLLYYQNILAQAATGGAFNKMGIIIIGMIALSESLKKSLRVLLQLAFLNKLIALTEIWVIILYVSSVWIWYFLGYSLTLNTLLIPMLLTSLFGLARFIYATYILYKNLPNTPYIAPLSLTQRIVHARFFNYAITVSHLIFSGNIIVPFFALHFGWETAGIFKLVSTLTYSITTLFNKIMGTTSEALLANAKEMGLEIKRSLFALLTRKSYQAILVGIIFFITAHVFLGLFSSTPHMYMIPMIYLFVILQLSEQFFMVYEKFYITEEKARDLFIFTFTTMIFLFLSLYTVIQYGPLAALCAMLIVRILSFVSISYLSYHHWKIAPSWRFNNILG